MLVLMCASRLYKRRARPIKHARHGRAVPLAEEAAMPAATRAIATCHLMRDDDVEVVAVLPSSLAQHRSKP